MPEIRANADAVSFNTSRELREARQAGGFYISPVDPDDGEQYLWYVCPCGCGALSALLIGSGFKPASGPSWKWDGDTEKPTLEPSVNHVGHWHGWLREGKWVSV